MELGVYLQNEPDKEWEKSLLKEGVRIRRMTEWSLIDGITAWILLTDNVEWVKRAAEEDIPVIYYQASGTPNVYQGDMTVLELSDLDAQFLEQIYRRHKGLPWTIAVTERLWIRESVPEDFEELYRLYSGKEVRRFLPALEEKEKEKAKLEAYIKNQYRFYGYGLYTLLDKETGEIIGRAGFENREIEEKMYVEIGYLIREDCQNQGYATEAVLALLNCLTEYTGEETAVIFCHPENAASIRVGTKAMEIYLERVQIRFSS